MLYQLDFIGEFLEAKVKNRVFAKLDRDMQITLQNIQITLEEPWYYWSLCMEWLTLESYLLMSWQSGYLRQASFNLNSRCLFIISMHQMKKNKTKIYYVDDCAHWYTYEALLKWFVDDIGKIFHQNFLVYAHWFMLIRISQMKDYYISVDQDRYATSIVAKYLGTDTVKTSTRFYKTTFPYDVLFTKSDASTSDEQVEKFTR